MKTPANAARSVAILVLALHAADAVRLGWADHLLRRGTLLEALSAASLDPLNSAAAMAAGRLEDDAGMDPRENFRRAIVLNPRDAAAWIRLGLAAEQSGDNHEAERCLLMAASYSTRNEPRWTLANFYFRRQAAGPFWQWAGHAARNWYRDPAPLFDLAWAMTSDGAAVKSRVVDGNGAALLAGYAAYLGDTGRLGEAFAAAMESRDPKLAPLVETLLAAYRVNDAARLAEALRSDGAAFAWRAVEQEGARWDPPSLHIDGRQPERCDLLARTLPAAPGRARLRWTAQGTAAREAGFRLRISTAERHARVLGETALSTAAMELTVPAGVEGVQLVLSYARPAGQVRASGSIQIDGTAIERVR